ncbi:MAG: L-threonylcarbamoyladenylate synthase [Holophagaceae bacterium]|nr:L-threonylcarbamoyladenylate synthase [Holophagaceae bacterium]
MLNSSPNSNGRVCTTQILDGFDRGSIDRAVSVLHSGGLVAFPTETVYGLGADGLNSESVAKIFEAKGRPSTNPLILHVSSINVAESLVRKWTDLAQKLADKFWPGPLTIILPASGIVPEIVRAGNPTVALRCPNHQIALELLTSFDGPLAAPSANKTTETSPTKPEHVLNSLAGKVDLILDGGRTVAGIESTIINLAETPPRLLRPGPICPKELEEIVGKLSRFEGTVPTEIAQIAPGMSQRHYAPKARLTIHEATELVTHYNELKQNTKEKIVAVVFGSEVALPPNCDHRRLPLEPYGASARLYAVLHDLDSQGYQEVLFQKPPLTEDWLAVTDRLSRAADGG